jgi:GNAT superfamily N-acetyltransferase
MMRHEWHKGEYTISTDPQRIDVETVHNFLTHSYWAEGIPFDLVKRSLEHSLSFGVYKDTQQIGFARLVTDYTTFAYLADVFVLEEYRGQGLGKWLMEVIIHHPDLQGFRRWLLATRDAHGLYRQYGFTPLRLCERFMEIWDRDVYKRSSGAS